MKKAWILQGGWDGHEPVLVSARFAGILRAEGFETTVFDTLDALLDREALNAIDLLVPAWTMGTITNEQCRAACDAVASGVGIAGCHGGMCDAFRNATEWQFMTGGQWVAHPGNDGTPYRVFLRHNASSSIVEGLSDFDVSSEQYYVHIDPCVNVLATTRFPVADGPHAANGAVDVPVVWTKLWGKGRVFYNSLGHHDDVFNIPEAQELMRRGFLWAARK
ncbi:MAG: ThuA domain-containing protein [Clostridiaceae bacterium]|nr:ThuA domain-containing protein [Clostridiaceae bacterium]